MTQSNATDDRPLGLRFVVEAINDVETETSWRALCERRGDAALGERSFDEGRFAEAKATLRRVFTEPELASAAPIINETLTAHQVAQQLTQLADGRWALRPTPQGPHDDAAATLLALGSFGLARWASDQGRAAWGICAAPGCERVFVDEGRKEPQRFCGTTCATRVRVAAHRRKQQSS